MALPIPVFFYMQGLSEFFINKTHREVFRFVSSNKERAELGGRVELFPAKTGSRAWVMLQRKECMPEIL